jgi:hypothetical protein
MTKDTPTQKKAERPRLRASVKCENGHWKPILMAWPLDNAPCPICKSTKLMEAQKNEKSSAR